MRTKIQSGGVVTTATLAAHLELSKATISHVLNGRGTELRIRQETQDRVLRAAADLGYRPNASARAIRTGRFRNIALIQSLKGVYLPTLLLQAMVEAVAESDMSFSISEVPDDAIEDVDYFPKVVRESSADGLLINRILHMPQTLIERIHSINVPAVFINVKYDVDCVHPDEVNGGYTGTTYLLQLGHKRIAYVQPGGRDKEHFSQSDRRAGYETAMMEAGLRAEVICMPPEPTEEMHSLPDPRICAAYLVLAGPDRPSAAITYEIAEAMALFHAARLLGLQIPQDLSILTFHWGIDTRLCVPFTTITNAIGDVGRAAVKMLLEKIDMPTVPLRTRTVPVILMTGGTAGPPSS